MHPDYVVSEQSWATVRLAGAWKQGVLPEPGGVQDQALRTVLAIEVVLSAWGKLEAEHWRKVRGE